MIYFSIIVVLLIMQVYLASRKSAISLATMLLPIPVLIFFVSDQSSNYIFNVLFHISLALAIALVPITLFLLSCQEIRSDGSRPLSKIIAIAIIKTLNFSILLLPFIIFWPIGILLIPVFIAISMQAHKISKYNTILFVISTIGSAMRQNLPLPMALTSAASNTCDKQTIVLRRISSWLAKGYSLSESIKLGFPKCSTDILAMITAAEQINQLPDTIESIEQDLMTKSGNLDGPERFSLIYPAVVLGAGFIISMGLAIFIIPTFAEVLFDLSDGDIPLPKATIILLNMGSWILGRHGFNILIVCSPLILLICMSVYNPFTRPRQTKLSLAHKIYDSFRWHFITHWFERNYALSQICGLLKRSLAAGIPVDQAIQNCLTLDLNFCFKKKIERWHKLISNGENISNSAKKLNISDSISWAFDTRINQPNTPDILEMLQKYYRSIYTYRLNIAKSIAMPISIVMLGGTIAFILFAMFTPIVTILTFLTDTALP